MKALLLAGACALAFATASRAEDSDSERVSELVVTAPLSIATLAQSPVTQASITAEAIDARINLVTPEDALRYLPDVLIRQRHIGDTQSPVTTRTSGVGASARSLIYVDGMLVSALIGNNNTSASPKWGLVAPDSIERVDVLYGPFSAAYAGNSIGSVISFTTRMPQHLEESVEVQGAAQSFAKYGEDRTYWTARAAAELGDRLGPFTFRLSYNHLDTEAQPLTYATAVVPRQPSSSGTPVTGAFSDLNRNGQPVQVLGATAIERQLQDNLSGRISYEFTPSLTAAYSFGLFRNDDQATSNSYLRDAAGQAVYAGQVNIGGRAYVLANTAFSSGVYSLRELQLAQGLSLGSHTGGAFDFELIGTVFDYLESHQRVPSGALPAAFVGGPGSLASLDGTGWQTLDANGVWRPRGPDGAHIVSFGGHEDGFVLANPKSALADWTSGAPGALQTLSRGKTRTWALWAQDVWTLAPGLKATLGGRLESWRAYAGRNYSAAPALDAAQPHVRDRAFSPKSVLAWTPRHGWTFKASVGLASRFPTVTELYQAVTVGTQLQTPNPDLKPERALSSELSASRDWSSTSLRVSVFDERIRNTLLAQTALLPSGATASFVQNVDRTHATGVEVVLDRRDVVLKGLELSGWGTYVDARTDRDPAFPAAQGKALPQLPHWRGALAATYAPTPEIALTLAGRYSSRAYASIDNSDPVANTYQGFSGYLVLDAHARYRLTQHLTAEAGVDNLTGRSYFLFHPFPQRTAIFGLRYER